jgi:hypothetical protein
MVTCSRTKWRLISTCFMRVLNGVSEEVDGADIVTVDEGALR